VITITILVALVAFLAAGAAALIRGVSNFVLPPLDDDDF